MKLYELQTLFAVLMVQVEMSVTKITVPQSSVFIPQVILSFIQNLKPIQTIHIADSKASERDWIQTFNFILSRSNSSFLFEIEKFNKKLMTKKPKNTLLLLSIEHIANFEDYFRHKTNESEFCFEKVLITLKNKTTVEIARIFKISWKKFVHNINVLLVDESSQKAQLFTFLPFQSSCDDFLPVKINEFDGKSLKWSANVFFPEKFKNLRKCVIRAGTYDNVPGTIIIKKSDGTQKLSGYEVEIIEFFGSVLKFTPQFKIFPLSTGSFLPNKTATGLMRRAFENEVDLIFSILSLQQTRKNHLSETKSLHTDKIVLVIPQAELVNPIQKLFLTFELFTWLGLFIVIIIACIVISILKLFPRKYHSFIVGENTKTEFLNIWIILLGGTQEKLPMRNFSRYLLMMFVMFCLVMRTLYLGSLYNLLKNDISEKKLKTIDELINSNYDFYVYDSLAPRVKDEKFMKR